MIGIPLLASIGTLVGRRSHIWLKGTWQEYPTFWVVIIADSGKMKSPPLRMARVPLKTLDREEGTRYTLAVERYEREMSERDSMKKGEMMGTNPPPKPVRRDYTTGDINMEAVADALQHTPGLYIAADEMVSWVQRMNQYRKGADRQSYMSMWSGEDLQVRRKTSRIDITNPVVSVVGSIQPEVVPSLHGEVRVADGFIYRILPMFPDLPVIEWSDGDIVPQDLEDMMAMFRSLDMMPFLPDVSLECVPSERANREFVRWYNSTHRTSADIGGPVGSFYGKSTQYCGRFAHVVHLAKHPQLEVREVSLDTMLAAIEITESFRPHIHEFANLLQVAKTSAKESKSSSLWHKVVKAYRLAVRCHGCQVSENHEISDTCFVTAREMYRKASISKEELLNELNTHIDLVEIRQSDISGGEQISFRLTRCQEKTEILTPDTTRHLTATDPNPPPF
jgi:hypothetical protein